jgi:hypothetical protein
MDYRKESLKDNSTVFDEISNGAVKHYIEA